MLSITDYFFFVLEKAATLAVHDHLITLVDNGDSLFRIHHFPIPVATDSFGGTHREEVSLCEEVGA